MSRSPQQRSTLQKQQLSEQEAAAASELFDLFCVATTMRQILGLHRDMCDILGLRPAPINDFYPKLKAKIRSWKAQALWKKFDARAAHRVYAKGTASTGTRVLVIGAGPCGMRAAIEAQLLGAKVVVLEKRDRITRNNVLHLWPFVITDLRNLGAKKFYGKFCAGSIDHISIRQLQIILMKVALLLGVEIHENVSFERTIEPCGDGFGWRASVSPPDHVVSYYEFDVLIGADGKRNTLEGFKRKEFRGKLAIAITANFINKKTEAEAKAEEISGVAFIFNQSFFKELYEKTGIDLENIVYYKDETHYFVMTAKKHSLIDKGVIIQDFSDPAELLATGNVNTEKLLDYAREAAEFSTKYQMPNLEFAVNHYGKPDVAMFDFTSMFAAETSCRVIMRNNYRLLQCLVGDSLLEPFWPTGSGCARGFLSSMDAAYAIKLWSNTRNSILAVVAQRESIYRLLGQTTPENLQRDTGSYTVDPASRYPNLNRTAVGPYQVKTLIDTDDPTIFEQPVGEIIATQTPINDAPVALRRTRRSIDAATLGVLTLRWVCSQLDAYDFVGELKEPADVIQNGKSLCALISRFRPDLIDYHSTMDLTSVERNDVAFRILETEFQIPRIMSGEKSINLDKVDARLWLGYLSQVREAFRGEVPHLKHAKVDIAELREKYRINITHAQPDFSKLLQLSTKPKYPKSKSPIQDTVDVPQIVQRRSVLDEERVKRLRRHEPASGTAPSVSGQQVQTDSPRRAKKRRNADKPTNIEERQRRLQEIEANRQERMSKRRQQRYQQTQNFYKSLQMLHANTLLRESDEKAFEDYSIFLYRQQAPEFNDRVKELERKLLYPDRDRSDIPSAMPRGNTDEQFSDRIKSMEQRISSRTASATDKKPKDLMRAIGKIDSSDWNVREIEKKIEQSKRTEIHGPKGREKVPKWSKEQFLARQHKMAKPNRQDSIEEKYKDIDQTLKNFTKQLKEGSVLEVGERGRNKVASIAGQFVKKDDNTSDEKNPPTIVPKPSAKVALAFKKQAASEKCHFCKQIVYLMEKITAEALVFHRSCLKCHHCHTNLRLGGYAFDRDDPNGRFYCTQHFRLPAKAIRPVVRKPGQRKPTQQQQAAAARAGENAAVLATENITDAMKTPDKLRGPADNVVQLDLLDRGQTPERIEFENTDAMSDGEPSEEHILDEHEWSGRNFLPESNQDSESDLSTTDDSDSDSDPNMFEEANDSPLGAQTLQLATDWIGKQNYSDSDDSVDFYDSSEGIADDGKDDTEGEEFKKARELRREEVRLLPLPANLPTDTETELKLFTENKENIEVIPQKMTLTSDAVIEPTQKVQVDNISEKSYNSAKSFKSAASSIDGSIVPPEVSTVRQELSTVIPPTKADIEKIEQTTGRKFSAEIEAISEKLHRLNSVVKMNKDLESLAKENLVKSDILKKLTMKEKWLADNAVGASNPMSPKQLKEKWLADNAVSSSNSLGPKATFGGKFTSKEDIHKVDSTKANETKEGDITNNVKLNLINSEVEQNSKTVLEEQKSKEAAAAAILESLKSEIKSANLNRANRESSSVIPSQIGKKPASRSNSFKSNASSSPKATTKSANVSRTNSLKRSEKFTSKDEAIAIDSRMQLQNILGLVKSIDNVTKPKNVQQEKNNELNNETLESSNSDLDMGKMLYDVENKFSPKADRRMSEKLKEIEARNFAGTMDFIKSQIVTPTVSAQATPVDLSKYFPNQKQQKSSAGAANKTQKNLKDVDLAKYFPTSPTPQKRTVVTVADKLKKSQTEKALAPTGNAPKSSGDDTAPTTTKTPAKRQASLSSSNFSLRDHQLDGAVDLTKKKTPVVIVKSNAVKAKSATVTTTAAAATVTKKGNVKVIKKILPKKGGKSKKVGATTGAEDNDKKIVVPRDEIDCKLDEILGNTSQEMRSPSLEYQKLFTEEKSPSEDISDKIERIYQETGIDLGIPKRSPSSNKKKLLKTKSLGEGEFDLPSKRNSLQSESKPKEYGDRPTGVQGLLQRFESMSTVKSFKLERMESSASNLNKSRESIVSHESIMSRDSLISRESDSLSDLEKTMEYLKTEWRNEATNFLQKKRDKFYSQKRAIDQASAAKESELKKSKFDDLPVQYRESKIAKFFGIKARSPEKRKSLIKNKSPEKKLAKKSPSPLKNARKVASLESSAVESKKPVSDILRVTTKKAEGPTKSEDHKSNTASENVTQKNGLSNAINDKFGEDKPKLEPKSLSENKVSKEVNNINTNSFNAVVTPIGPNEFIAEVVPITKISETLKENIPFQDAHLTKSTLSRQNSNSSNNLVSETNSPVLKRRPLVEDIRNLPKTGCDKSLSSSRRNSQSSLQSRRCSDSSLTEQLGMIDSLTKTLALDRNVDENFAPVQSFTKIISRDSNANEKFDPVESFTKTFSLDGNVDEKFVLAENFTNKLSRGSSANEKFAPLESFTKTLSLDGDVNEKFVRVENFTKRLTLDSNVDEQFKNIVDELDSVNVNNVHPNLQVIRAEDECDSLCTSISKSPSAAPTTVRVRGSSEDESIEKLFSQFSDAMLVNVEFDSNDELVAITPRVDLINDPDADKDYLDRWESLEKDDDMTMNLSTYAESTKMPRNSEKKGNIKNERSAEILKLKGNRNSKSLATDLEKELVRESKLSMPLSDTQATPFPVRPQRRQKSTSSSSEASTPIVPQRIKKKLAKLSPADMPPSVQDVLQVVISSNPPNQNEPLEKFPKNVSEDELIVESAAWKIKNEIPVHIGPRQIEESLKTKGDIHLNNTAVLKQLPNSECKQAELHKISNTSSNYDAVIHNSNNSCVNESLSSRASKTENVTERKKDFSVNQTKFKSDALLEKTIEKMNNFNNAVITPGSSRIKSLNATNHSSQESLNRSVNIGSSPKAASKERSLEWDMTKMPASPMPRRKFVHAERRGFDDLKLSRDSSPTTSIKILNNLSRNGSDSEESQKRIIEDFEIERRQALIERDKNFQDMVSSLPEPKKQDKESNSSNSKKSTSLPTPRSSRRSTHSSINVTRDGTPPMFKKLVVPSDDEISMVQPLSSRCSSFAFIELLSNGEAIVAPMPKPLNIPQTTPKYETPKDEPIPEVFQNRPWPRPQSESESCESPECDSIIEAKRAESEPKVPVEKVFLNRKWPDGKTVFKEEPEEDEFDESLLERAVTQRRTVLRPHSQTPPSRRKLLTAHDVMSAKSGSKSISDLRNQSPQISTYSSDQSLSHELASTHSSGDSGLSPRVSCESQPITTKTVTRHMPTGESVDVNTRMLLDRSKRLHNRKSDFMNERAAERNPYMRDVVNAERLERQALEKAQEELECYRPDHYTNPVTRFPTSRTLGRSRNVPTYQSSYTPSAVPAYTDYGLSNRRLYNPTLPTSVGSSLDYNPYSTRSSTAYGRGSSYNDYYKRSPSRQREREHSKESCVIS